MVSAQVRREQVEYAKRRGLSYRRACALLGLPRSTLRYQARRPSKDATLVARLKALAERFPRFGYRRLHAMLRRQGKAINVRRAERLCAAHGLVQPRCYCRIRIQTGPVSNVE